MNFILAWVLFSICMMSGMPASVQSVSNPEHIKDTNLVIVSVLKDSPAEIAGLQARDKIVHIESGEEFVSAPNITPEALQEFVLSRGSEEIQMSFLRGKNNEFHSVALTPAQDDETSKPMIGIAMDTIGTLKLSPLAALWEGMKFNVSVTAGTAVGLYNLAADAIKGQGSFDSVTGPVGIVGIVGDAYQFGFVYLLSFAALISINLAIINLIPFPALDGGRLLFLLIEKIKGSRIRPAIANYANIIGFALLIILMLVVTYHDIIKLL